MDSVIDPNASKEVAMTSLDWCARSRQLSLLNAVLSAHFSSASISDLERECGHVLRNAVTSGCKETLTSLLRHVDDAFLHQHHDGVEARDDVRGGRTRLQKLLGLAVEHGHRDVAEVLLLKGADPNTSFRNKPLLHLSLSLGHQHVASLLVQHGADVNLTDGKGETPLFAALSSDALGMETIIEDLIKRGADVNHRSLTGRQPIHCAALASGSASAKALTRLAEAGCDVSVKDGVLGDTPLHLACSRCSQEAVVVLVRHGADFNAANNHGDTPLRKLLQHATRVSRDFHHTSRVKLAKVLVAIGFRLLPSKQDLHARSTRPLAAHISDRASSSVSHHREESSKKQTKDTSKARFNTQVDGPCSLEDVRVWRDDYVFAADKSSRKGKGGLRRDKVEEVFQAVMKDRVGRVPALQHLCRLQVRRCLPPVRFRDNVGELEVSPHLRQYLMFSPLLWDDSV